MYQLFLIEEKLKNWTASERRLVSFRIKSQHTFDTAEADHPLLSQICIFDLEYCERAGGHISVLPTI